MARKKQRTVSRTAVSREDAEVGPIIKRPDGYYWESKQTGELRGPFAAREEAEADRLAGGAADDEFGAGETLQEAESEIGVSEWIDPDTGGPAEDSIPRLEDH